MIIKRLGTVKERARNKRMIGWMALTLLLSWVVTSCERQTLECEYIRTIGVPVHIDWSVAQIKPQNVSLLIYDRKTKKLITEHCFANNNKDVQTMVYLPVGKYTVVAINELRDQVDYVRIAGYQDLSTLRAYPVKNYQELTDEYKSLYLSEPDILAFAVVKNMDLTNYGVDETTYLPMNAKNAKEKRKEIEEENNRRPICLDLMNMVAKRLVGRCNINLYIDNIKSARFPILANLRNLSTGYLFDKDENEQKFGAFRFEINDSMKRLQSSSTGIISASFATFGLSGDRFSIVDQPKKSPLMLDLMVMLTDQQKTIKRYTLDVTDHTSVVKEKNGAFTISIVDTLHQNLPIIRVNDSNESGFHVDHADWSEVNVTLYAP